MQCGSKADRAITQTLYTVERGYLLARKHKQNTTFRITVSDCARLAEVSYAHGYAQSPAMYASACFTHARKNTGDAPHGSPRADRQTLDQVRQLT